MSDTIRRLQEVEVLFNQMKNSSDDHIIFRANLNAFVSQARTVTWVMKKEFDKKPRFKEWYELKENEMGNDEIFEFFKDLRNVSIHEKPIGNKMKFITTFNGPIGGGKEIIIPFGRVDERGNIVIDNESKITIDGKPSDTLKSNTQRQYFFDEKPDLDAVTLCLEYLQKLIKIGLECNNKFKSSEPIVDRENLSKDVL